VTSAFHCDLQSSLNAAKSAPRLTIDATAPSTMPVSALPSLSVEPATFHCQTVYGCEPVGSA
jgi:hypothetical protein